MMTKQIATWEHCLLFKTTLLHCKSLGRRHVNEVPLREETERITGIQVFWVIQCALTLGN